MTLTARAPPGAAAAARELVARLRDALMDSADAANVTALEAE